jgi:hypothetical protein
MQKEHLQNLIKAALTFLFCLYYRGRIHHIQTKSNISLLVNLLPESRETFKSSVNLSFMSLASIISGLAFLADITKGESLSR